jgi:hypothetical protein
MRNRSDAWCYVDGFNQGASPKLTEATGCPDVPRVSLQLSAFCEVNQLL